MANARLGWFSPLGLAASIRASVRRLTLGLTASAFRHAPIRSCPRRVGSSAFRFGDGRSAGWPSGSLLPLFGTHRFGVALGGLVFPLGGLAFGFTASAFRHAPIRASVRRVGLRAHCFRFSVRTASKWPLGELVLPPAVSEIALGGWPSGSLLPLFGAYRFAPPHRRSEDRRSTTTRHLFHFKTLIPTC